MHCIGTINQHLVLDLSTIWKNYSNEAIPKQGCNLDTRIIIRKHWSMYDQLDSLVRETFPTVSNWIGFYERQYNPTLLHVDPDDLEYTMIIPLHHDPRILTLLWKEKFVHQNQWHKFVCDWQLDDKVTNCDASQRYPLSHTWDENKQIFLADYLNLEAVYEYRLGSFFLFDAKQVHCSSDWTGLDIGKYKDFIGIHSIKPNR
jgi:hypothetical protein